MPRNRQWDHYLLGLARAASLKSKDPSTKTGAVITDQEHGTLATGFNGFPRGVHDHPLHFHDRYEPREEKYRWTVHAEVNAILQAARRGIPLEGTRIYCTLFPCEECAKVIIQAGIKEVVAPVIEDSDLTDRWKESFARTNQLFKEAGVSVHLSKE